MFCVIIISRLSYNAIAYATLHGLMCNVVKPERPAGSEAHKLSYMKSLERKGGVMNLKFELRKQWTGEYKTNLVKRFLARRMAKSIFRDSSSHYQFSGWTGSLKREYVMCLASKYQLMHWILFNAGYSCSVANILERCGVDYREWEKQEMDKSSSDFL